MRTRETFWLSRTCALAAVFPALAAGCSDTFHSSLEEQADFRLEIDSWRDERDQSLRKEDGWLTLAGLYWLDEGDNSFGSVQDNDVVFPEGTIAEQAGEFVRQGREVTLRARPGVVMTIDESPVDQATVLALDTSEGGATVVNSGSLSFHGIERGDLIGIRLKDSQNRILSEFEGMEYFEMDKDWRKIGRYELFEESRILRTPNILGSVNEEEIFGQVTFEVDGETHSLQPSGDPGEGFFVVFGDRTNGKETYGGGRFVYAEPVQDDGTVVLDFNKAYCPPCVFTPYATCPLPPPDNKLPFRIEAGEKMFGAAHWDADAKSH